MTNLGVVFLTGLTTGGLSCLAVQGGLLASSVAHQAEKDIQHPLATTAGAERVRKTASGSGGARRNQPVALDRPPYHLTWPIVLFLTAKLVASTLLGFLLGGLGAVLQLTPFMRAILQLAIGIFLLGTALRMLNIHPIFRYFALEPPSFLKRSLRRRAQAGTRDSATPIILGALTVFIPCGITQAMMALAIGAGDPWFGAAIMFAFTLGTSPVFLAMAYLANRLGAAMEARFLKLAAVVVLILGLVAIDTGSTLLGSPFSFAALRDSISVRQALPASAFGLGIQQDVGAKSSSGQAATPSVIAINVSDYGYEPRVLRAKAGQTVQLQVVTKDSVGCTRAFVIPALNLQRVLPETGTTIIDLPAQQAGTLRFTCAMGMFSGAIQFED